MGAGTYWAVFCQQHPGSYTQPDPDPECIRDGVVYLGALQLSWESDHLLPVPGGAAVPYLHGACAAVFPGARPGNAEHFSRVDSGVHRLLAALYHLLSDRLLQDAAVRT